MVRYGYIFGLLVIPHTILSSAWIIWRYPEQETFDTARLDHVHRLHTPVWLFAKSCIKWETSLSSFSSAGIMGANQKGKYGSLMQRMVWESRHRILR